MSAFTLWIPYHGIVLAGDSYKVITLPHGADAGLFHTKQNWLQIYWEHKCPSWFNSTWKTYYIT